VEHYIIYDSDSVRVFEGLSTPFSTGITSFAIAETDSGIRYLVQSTGHQWGRREYFYSFIDNSAHVVLSRYAIPAYDEYEEDYVVNFAVSDFSTDEYTFNDAPFALLGIIDIEHPRIKFPHIDIEQFR